MEKRNLSKGDTFQRNGVTHTVTDLVWKGRGKEAVIWGYIIDNDLLKKYERSVIEKYFKTETNELK